MNKISFLLKLMFSKKIFRGIKLLFKNPQLFRRKLENYLYLNFRFEKPKKLHIKLTKKFKNIEFEKPESPLVSIIIPVHNNFVYTYNCLLSIKRNAGCVKYEIIVVDDASNDKTKNIDKYIKGIKLIVNKENKGFLLNINTACKFAKGKYLYLLNNDTMPQENFLSELVSCIEKDNAIGIVGSKLIYSDGKLQEAGGIIWKDGSAWNYGNGKNPDDFMFNYFKEVDYVSGASLLIRKDLWLRIGGFDPLYIPAYNEDSDLCFSARELGYKVIYVPTSCIVHFEGRSNGVNVKKGIKRYQVLNKSKFYKKWHNYLSNSGQNVFYRRDRSFNKKSILIIDHYVPTFDKDAGSRTVYEYIKLFISLGYNVKFLPDNRFKLEPYTSILERMGVEVIYGIKSNNFLFKYLKSISKYIDFVLLNRPHITIKYIKFIRKNFKKSSIYYYGHDFHTLRLEREFKLTNNKSLYKDENIMAKYEKEIFGLVDKIYYPSIVEVNLIKKINRNYDVSILQPYIFSINKFKSRNPVKNTLLFVGGFGHRPNVDACIWFVNKIFPKILRKVPNTTLLIAGSNPPNEILNMKNDSIKIYGYISEEKLAELFNNSEIFIAPLRYGAGIKGKIVEALYNQIPIVTTHIGAEGIKDASKSMIIEDNEDGFAKGVLELFNNNSLKKTLVKNGLNVVNNFYSKERAERLIRKDFN